MIYPNLLNPKKKYVVLNSTITFLGGSSQTNSQHPTKTPRLGFDRSSIAPEPRGPGARRGCRGFL
jgi:hypothetical protein